ncbi:cation diffusion facilitator family transporter [Novosphingobium colocasiae]|nr:cation diffusion facilitator family transporter [Novosphingobium colocasiae]
MSSHHHAPHDHDHSHDHGHGHGHHHHAPPPPGSMSRAFALAVALNAGFVVAEAVAGFYSGSMALLADAGHNLSDVLSLLLAWGASVLAMRPPSQRFTYGLKSSSILASLANAALLWVAIGMILVETVRRFFEPSTVAGPTMMVVAAAGILVNALSAMLFARGSKSDLNLRAAFVHLMADAAVSAGVVIAGLLIWLTGRQWIDPVTSLIITAVIGWSSWGLLRDSLRMGMLAVPEAIDSRAVRDFLTARPGVTALHDLHIWPMSTTETALTVHLVMDGAPIAHDFLSTLADDLDHRFGIGHATVQIETASGAPCALECLEGAGQ